MEGLGVGCRVRKSRRERDVLRFAISRASQRSGGVAARAAARETRSATDERPMPPDPRIGTTASVAVAAQLAAMARSSVMQATQRARRQGSA
ncbi:hypothetical protein Scep_030137 [Stephania cephalantha]|uniref:Uncharacterized protein n=1 Tax=Stephania cephalantha TaxID=152367 RepID=A0AAP0DZ59_9MAGN